MLKAVFRPQELIAVQDKVVIDPPASYSDAPHLGSAEEADEDNNDVEEYTGPTADDLRREAEQFKSQWEEEKEKMTAGAKAEAENIINEAQRAAFEEVKRKTDEAQVLKQQAEEEAERITADAKTKAAEIENEVRQTLDAERKDSRDKGSEEGREKGYGEGKAEVQRLIERTQVVLERAQDKRGEILAETEQEIVDLVLLIARKVIKVISENQRDVIIANVIQALRKVKSKGNVIIRVNMSDMQLATEHKQEFIKLMENANSIQVVEDSSVDKGGCIIETDFGEIDARISSQLAELESKILEISPIKSSEKLERPQMTNKAAENAVSSSLLDTIKNAASASPASTSASDTESSSGEDGEEMTQAAKAALTASAAMAALATLGTKGRRETDKKLKIT
jgi:flagellar assembly protein FliH